MRLLRVGVRVVLCAWFGVGVRIRVRVRVGVRVGARLGLGLGLGSGLGLGLGPGLGEGLGEGQCSSVVPCASMCSGVRPVRGVRQLVTW